MPDATGLELLAQELRDADAESVLDTVHFRGKGMLIVEPSAIRAVLEALRAKGYDFLASVHGVDYYPEEPRLGVHYELLDMAAVDRLTVKLRVHTDAPNVDSVTPDWPTANHQEREVFDMFGVVFAATEPATDPHARGLRGPSAAPRLPDRRRADPVHRRRAARQRLHDRHRKLSTSDYDHRAVEDSVTMAPLGRQISENLHDELLTLNFGPHHPATHGVLRLLVTLEGEVVRDSSRSSATSTPASRRPPRTRATGRPSPSSSGWTTSPTTSTRRRSAARSRRCSRSRSPSAPSTCASSTSELNRIMSHLVWLGTSCLDLGAISMFWYGFRERERILDLFEQSSGQRMHTRYIQVGGVIEDIPLGFEEKLRQFLAIMPSASTSTRRCSTATRSSCSACATPVRSTPRRCSASGSRARCCAPPASPGTCARPTRTPSYEDFRFKVPIGTVGDNYDRFSVRVEEMRQSVRIIEQALDGLPEGPWITDDRKVALPPRHELATSMEALIHHFKLVTEGFRVPPGEVYYPIEGPRGELACFIRSDGSSKPARVHMRDPSFVNLQATKPMVQDSYIADLIATLAMLDPILGGIDR